MKAELAVRSAQERDMGFVYDAWLESYKFSHSAGPIPMDIYFDAYRKVLGRILARTGVSLLMAINPVEDDPQHELYGFLVYERYPHAHKREPCFCPGVHYVFVKEAYRRLGVCRALFQAAEIPPRKPFYFSFKTSAGIKLVGDSFSGGVFDPLVVRFPQVSHEAVSR